MYTVIEDCSPYYIRFTFDGLEKIIQFVSNQQPIKSIKYEGYAHDTLDILAAESIISMLPMSTVVNFKYERVAIFTTPPEGGCGIHKDGFNNKTSFNIPIEILDNKCVTNWYEDKKFSKFPLNGDTAYTRLVYPDYKKLHYFTPIKSMIAQPNEMILFNTDIYHSWDNANSSNTRKMLTLRITQDYSFADTKKILFEIDH
jgi:hypothetical protein